MYASATGADSNWALYNAAGDIFAGGDTAKTYWGGGKDAYIQYGGSNLEIKPDEVGTGYVHVDTAQALALVIGSGTAGVDYQVKFDGESNDGVITWQEDEDYFKFGDDILMNGEEKAQFRDTAVFINSADDGHLDLDADTSIDLNALVDISAQNIKTDTTTGTKIGTATSQKLGFFNATPVDQPATVNDPSGGATVDAEARTAIEAIIDRLQELGLIA